LDSLRRTAVGLESRVAELETSLKRVRDQDVVKGHVLDLLGQVTAQHTVDDICRVTVEGVRALMGFERAGLFLWEEGIKTFRGTFGTDMDLQTTDEHGYVLEILPGSPEERIIAGSVLERGCKLGAPAARPGEESVKADLIGLRLDGKLYGILSVDNRLSRRPITDLQLEHLMLLSRVLGNALEVTRARHALVQSDERFRQVTETSGEWIWELDREGRYTYSSPMVRMALGYVPGDVVGQRLLDWVVEDDKSRVGAELSRVIVEKTPIRHLIHNQVHRDGYRVVLEMTGSPILDDGGRVIGLRGAHRDVTREKDLEAQLRHSQKIEAIGRLAGGIAHDFNNILTAILGCSSLLLEDMGKGDPLRADVERIQMAGERAAVLTRQLLAFSRRQSLRTENVDINALVREMEKLLHRTIGEDIELVIRLDDRLKPVDTDPDQVQQVLLHLAVNARDAMLDPAVITGDPRAREELELQMAQMPTRAKKLFIETDVLVLDEAFCSKHVNVSPGSYVRLTVRDTGMGMQKEVRDHLFEPFFTTKEVGRGSGLGLSTIYGIVKQMGGFIEVDSAPGAGTTFRIYLPPGGTKSSKQAEAKSNMDNLTGKETILVVEDEEVVRRLTVRMLQTLGYQTIEAAHGGEALDICAKRTDPLHLILTDMIMPHMSGKQFIEELRKTRKDFKVLFVSGYSAADTVGGQVIGVDTPLIQKPFTREILARKVREVLDGA